MQLDREQRPFHHIGRRIYAGCGWCSRSVLTQRVVFLYGPPGNTGRRRLPGSHFGHRSPGRASGETGPFARRDSAGESCQPGGVHHNGRNRCGIAAGTNAASTRSARASMDGAHRGVGGARHRRGDVAGDWRVREWSDHDDDHHEPERRDRRRSGLLGDRQHRVRRAEHADWHSDDQRRNELLQRHVVLVRQPHDAERHLHAHVDDRRRQDCRRHLQR